MEDASQLSIKEEEAFDYFWSGVPEVLMSAPPSDDSARQEIEDACDVADMEESTYDEDASRNASLILRHRNDPYFGLVDNSPSRCVCRLCNNQMHLCSYRKHLKTRIHISALSKIRSQHQQNTSNSSNWHEFMKDHSWLNFDPTNSNFAYCTVCERRFVYPQSKSKRLQHENGSVHLKALRDSFARSQEPEKGEEDSQPDSIPEVSAAQDMEETVDSESTPGKRLGFKRGSVEWFKRFPWSKPCPNDPYAYYCIYCDLVLSVGLNREKHEKAGRHIAAAALKAAEGKTTDMEYTIPTQRARHQKVVYPWRAAVKNNPTQVFCKYCRVRLAPSTRLRIHDKTQRHQAAAAAFLEKQKKTISTKEHGSKTAESGGRVMATPTANALWVTRFPWLQLNAPNSKQRPNYAYCKLCTHAVYITGVQHAMKHQRCFNHVRQRMLRSGVGSNSGTTGPAVNTALLNIKKELHASSVGASPSPVEQEQPSPSKALPPKRRKPSEPESLTEIAEKLTDAHVQYLRWRRHTGRATLAENELPAAVTVQKKSLKPVPGKPAENPTRPTRTTFDLLMECVTQSVKSLPPDLISEFKMKVMQTVGDLELKMLRRNEVSSGDCANTSATESSRADTTTMHQQHKQQTQSTRPTTSTPNARTLSGAPPQAQSKSHLRAMNDSAVTIDDSPIRVRPTLAAKRQSSTTYNDAASLDRPPPRLRFESNWRATLAEEQERAIAMPGSIATTEPTPCSTNSNGISGEMSPYHRYIEESCRNGDSDHTDVKMIQIVSQTESRIIPLCMSPQRKLPTPPPSQVHEESPLQPLLRSYLGYSQR